MYRYFCLDCKTTFTSVWVLSFCKCKSNNIRKTKIEEVPCINSFSEENHFLSNFHPSSVYYEGLYYTSVESAFQSAKTKAMNIREDFCKLDPSQAKRKGRKLFLRDDWETVKDEVMYQCVKDKFLRNTNLKLKLLNTGDAELIEGNTWGDRYWGVCNGTGQNKLGQILMIVREELKLTE